MMAREIGVSRPRLSFEQAAAVCREFVPIGDRAFDYMEQLQRVGFEAFLPFEAFIVSFAANPGEVDLHRQCQMEMAKTLLGNPWPLMLVAGRPEEHFRSPLLQTLRAKRDEENGVPENQLGSRYGGGEAWWRSQIDPCRRHIAYFEVNNREIYDAHWAEVVDAMKSQVQEEAERFASDLATTHTFDTNGRYALFTAVMERDAAALGFQYDRAKSHANFPVFSKAINPEWDLCWAIEEPDFLFWNLFEGRFEPYLEVRSRMLRGSVRKGKAGEFLQLRYASVVPGFFNAYRTFYSLKELETVIKAHLCLYSLMAPIVQRGLENVLGAGHGAIAR